MSSPPMISLAQGRDGGEVIQTLTPAQERFAEKNNASPGERSLTDPRMVFFYREGPMLTRSSEITMPCRSVESQTTLGILSAWLVSPFGSRMKLSISSRSCG